jgi:hypothetical protein
MTRKQRLAIEDGYAATSTAADLHAENVRLKAELAVARELTAAQAEYVALLASELSELMPFVAVHGWRTTREDAGLKCRERIAAASAALAATATVSGNDSDRMLPNSTTAAAKGGAV